MNIIKDSTGNVMKDCKKQQRLFELHQPSSGSKMCSLIPETAPKEGKKNCNTSEKILCMICKNDQLRLSTYSEYSNHLLAHLEKLNELCNTLKLNEEIKYDGINLINLPCPCCSEQLTEYNHINTELRPRQQLVSHIKKCSWKIVSERKRVNLKSRTSNERRFSIHPINEPLKPVKHEPRISNWKGPLVKDIYTKI